MLETIRELLVHQYEAAYCTLHHCVVQCREAAWEAPVVKYPYCQVAFHALFFADYYLGRDEQAFRREAFHRQNLAFFGDYEQLQPREPTTLYDRPAILKYLDYCRYRTGEVLRAETAASLQAPCNFPGKAFGRAELHVYNIRHLQHHAAQLVLRLRAGAGVDIPWVRSGWQVPTS